MSSYLKEDQRCNPEDVVLIKSDKTGSVVYAFCNAHQHEEINPAYAFNTCYFRQLRDALIEHQKETGKIPHVYIPHLYCETKVITNYEMLVTVLVAAGGER